MLFGDGSISDVVNAYLKFLLVKYPGHEEEFRRLLDADPQTADAEAVGCATVL